MSLKHDSILAPAFTNAFLFIACLSLTALMTMGCSKVEEKAPAEKKKVVTTMNIPKDGEAAAQTEEPAQPAAEEIPSLPLEAADEEEEEMPDLGSGN